MRRSPESPGGGSGILTNMASIIVLGVTLTLSWRHPCEHGSGGRNWIGDVGATVVLKGYLRVVGLAVTSVVVARILAGGATAWRAVSSILGVCAALYESGHSLIV
jgi:hypothetical protein